MKKSMLSALAVGVGGSAVAGFGLAAGRDAYHTIKRNRGTIVLIAALAAAISMPFIGMRNAMRGHAPGEAWKGIGYLLMVPAGFGISFGLAFLVGAMFGEEPQALTFLGLAGAGVAAAVIGAVVGVFQRPATKRRYEIIARNEIFLAEQGISETGEEEVTHYDGEGNALRALERTPNSIVFMAVGKRNKRSYITLSPEGEMIDYSGVVALGSARKMGAAA